MDQDDTLRQHLVTLLTGRNAHVSFEPVMSELPFEKQGLLAGGVPNSPWQILEHMRIAQWDILEFSRDAKHVSPPFPAGYWPANPSPPHPGAWEESVAHFRSDLTAMKELVSRTADLYAPFPHGTGQSLLREALLVADHNAYHLGQLVLVRRLLGEWPA